MGSKGYILSNLMIIWFILIKCVIVVVVANALVAQSRKLKKNINSVSCSFAIAACCSRNINHLAPLS